MKPLYLLPLLLLFLVSCEIQDDPNYSGNLDAIIENNKSKITISTGIAGTLLKVEGNCMPIIGSGSTCRTYPVSRTLNIYEYTTIKDVEGWGPLYDGVNTKLVATCKADKEGFFQTKIKPGKYSIFICEGKKFYANGGDGYGGINPITVKVDSVSHIVLRLDYAYY
ncbi:MAG TPA: hypothetical protein PL115_02020 [Bacteroidales bacterium]|jgi:hypothetical protein|nr:hypothetical protein [Bacteroidales bacterium]HQN23414.1 hypothetical protein [Bacteroidales bacterium]HQP78623.1 hypothetical protein [Bacteroidales bacterium]